MSDLLLPCLMLLELGLLSQSSYDPLLNSYSLSLPLLFQIYDHSNDKLVRMLLYPTHSIFQIYSLGDLQRFLCNIHLHDQIHDCSFLLLHLLFVQHFQRSRLLNNEPTHPVHTNLMFRTFHLQSQYNFYQTVETKKKSLYMIEFFFWQVSLILSFLYYCNFSKMIREQDLLIPCDCDELSYLYMCYLN